MQQKGQNPLHQFPRSKSITSPQHKRQVCNKLARAKVRCVCCVVSFPKFHYNDLLADLLAVSITSPHATSWQLPRLRGNVCNGFWDINEHKQQQQQQQQILDL